MSDLLIDEARELEPGTGPWMVERRDENEGPSGENWLIADFGIALDASGEWYQQIYLTTDGVRASEDTGQADRDAEWVAWCRNHWRSILEAIAANHSPVGTDEEKIEARQQLEAWNRGEPIRVPMPDAEIMVFALQSQEAVAE